MKETHLTDEELWLAIQDHDSSRAFAVLYNRYWRKVYHAANHYLDNKSMARQILHDIFVVLWEKRKTLQIKNFDAYLRVAARYHVISHLRTVKRSPVVYVEPSGLVQNNFEEKSRYNDLENQLKHLLTPLPKRCREIFWMSRVDQLSNHEIAGKLGISKRTVENQITQALRFLKHSYKHIVVWILLTAPVL
jgi:RNA polymerase sigma-70 factor (family 1)